MSILFLLLILINRYKLLTEQAEKNAGNVLGMLPDSINTRMFPKHSLRRKPAELFLALNKIKKTFVEAIEDRLKTTFLHPVIKRNVSYKTLIRLECYNLIKHLKGTEEYKPFISES